MSAFGTFPFGLAPFGSSEASYAPPSGSAFPVIFQQLGCAMNLLDIVKKGSTDRSVTIRIIDSTTGAAENGVEHDTSGLALWYRREGAAKTDITAVALAALTTGHTDSGIELIGDGAYRLDLPDAAYATGANYVDVGGTVTGMLVTGGRVKLVNYDPEDTVRLGLTALPNAAADAAGGLPVSDAGGLDVDTILGRITANVATATALATAQTGITSIIKNAFIAVELAVSDDSDQDALVLTGGPTSVISNVIAILYDASAAGVKEFIEGSFNGGTGVLALSLTPAFTVANGDTVTLLITAATSNNVNVTEWGGTAVGSVTLPVNVTQISGDSGAADNAEAFFDGTGYDGANNVIPLVTTVTNLTNAPTSGDLTATMKASVNAEVDTALADYDGPTNAEMVARTLAAADYATAAALGDVNTVVDAAKAVTDKLDTALEDDGAGGWQLTTLALENGAGGGGGSDWTADEKTAIRSILGIPGSGTTPADPSSGILDTIRDQTTSAVLEAAARAGVMGTWTDETGASFVLIITG